MDVREIREYSIRTLAKNVAETPWLVLPGENKLVRRSIKFSIVKDHRDPDKFVGVHAEVLYQKRKSQKDPWPSQTIDLSKVPKGFGFKFSLDSAQTYELAQALQDVYPIGKEKLSTGKRTVVLGMGKDDIVITDKNKADVLRQLSTQLTEADLSGLIRKNISALPADLAIARIYHDRRARLQEFKAALSQDRDERYWQQFLQTNSWMFGTSCVEILPERRLGIHHTADFPIKTEGGFMDIVEIKRPGLPFWTQAKGGATNYKYRGKYLIPYPELQGALAQTSKYILQAEKGVDSQDYIDAHGGVVPLKPRGLIVHGRSVGWRVQEWESFRLLNDELHTVQVITFDHLYKQAERILAVMEVSDENPPLEEISADDISF